MLATQQASRQVGAMFRALILAAFLFALSYPIHQRADAQPRAAEDKGKAAEKASPAPTAAIENQLGSIASAIKAPQTGPEAKATEKRAQDDLDAQQDMARYALWMFFATALTAILTAAGVLLIWRTLIHTRRASKYAGVGARQARRAAIASDLMAQEAAKATLAAVEASKAGQEANRLTRNAQSAAQTTARWEARKAQRREAAADERAEAAYAVATRNADIAEAQVAVAQATARRQLRAYVNVEEVNIYGLVVGGKLKCAVNIRNRGATPAYQVRINTIWRPTLVGPQTKISFGEPAEEESTSDLGPGQFFTHFNRGDLLTDEDVRVLQTGELGLIFAGVVRYRDAFRKKRRVLFRYSLSPESVDWTKGMGALRICEKGNRSD